MALDPVRVLIVDDHEVFAGALQALLEGADDVVVVGVAHDGSEAFDLAVSADAEIVLMDLRLPTVDGYEATRRLRKIEHAAKVIALTGESEADVGVEIRAAGMIGYLSKDRVHEHLLDTIHAAAGR